MYYTYQIGKGCTILIIYNREGYIRATLSRSVSYKGPLGLWRAVEVNFTCFHLS